MSSRWTMSKDPKAPSSRAGRQSALSGPRPGTESRPEGFTATRICSSE